MHLKNEKNFIVILELKEVHFLKFNLKNWEIFEKAEISHFWEFKAVYLDKDRGKTTYPDERERNALDSCIHPARYIKIYDAHIAPQQQMYQSTFPGLVWK